MESGEERRYRAAKVMSEHPHPEIHIQPLTTLEHFERCVELQGEVWGYDNGDIVPRRSSWWHADRRPGDRRLRRQH